MNIAERNKIRTALKLANINARTMSDDEMKAAYDALENTPAPAPEFIPTPTPTPAPTLAEVEQAIKETTPETPETPAPAQDVNTLLAQAMKLLMANNQPSLDNTKVIELIKEHATKTHIIKINDAKAGTTKTIPNAHPKLPELLKSLKTAKIINSVPFLVGEAGTGKTTLAKQASEALELDFHAQGATYDVFALTGFKNASGEYIPTTFYEAFVNGGVFLFDELDSYSSECLTAINMALENGCYPFPNGMKQVHENFTPIAAANTDGRGSDSHIYNRNTLDGATLDRLRKIDCPLDLDLCRAITTSATKSVAELHDQDFNNATYERIWTFWSKARAYALENQLPFVVGLRDLRKLTAAVIGEGLELAYATEQTAIANMNEDQRRQAGVQA